MPLAAGLYYFAHEVENVFRPPAVLIHGAGGDHLYWPPQIRRLPNQRIFALDLPGHGRSDGVGHQSIEDYAAAVLRFLEAAGLNAAVLVGHSMGGAIALHLALHHPQRVLGLGLVASGARLRVAAAILQNASNPSTHGDAVALIIAWAFSPQAPPRLRELAARRMRETRPSVLYGDFLACDAFNVMEQLSRLTAPTLVICGNEDRMTPLRFSEFLRDNIPGARLEVVPHAGHMVMLEQPQAVANALAGFLDSIPYHPGQ